MPILLCAGDADLLWYEFEIRIRKQMKELLDPVIQKNREQDTELNRVHLNAQFLQEKLEAVEYALYMDSGRADRFQELHSKITEIVSGRVVWL